MVQVNLQDKSLRNLEKILAVLVDRKLVLNPSLSESQKYKYLEAENFLKYKVYTISAISRSILSKEIIRVIEEHNDSRSLEYYTVPILDMNWDQSSQIKEYFDHVKMVS